MLPPLPKEAGDRNRTSPFAFTGNKFEFRAVGSSANIAGANTVLNTIVAESLDFIATKLEADVKAGKDLNKAIQELLPLIINESKKVLFNGNGYSEEWHDEAEKRGLPNLKNTVEVLPVVTRKDTTELFAKYKVYTAKELESRFNILSEAYVKTLNIEAKTAAMIAKSMILPAASGIRRKSANRSPPPRPPARLSPAGLETFGTLVSAINDLQRGINGLEKAQAHHADGDPYATPSTCAIRRLPGPERSAPPPTSSKPSSPTTSGRCRRTAKCCSSSSLFFQSQ